MNSSPRQRGDFAEIEIESQNRSFFRCGFSEGIAVSQAM